MNHTGILPSVFLSAVVVALAGTGGRACPAGETSGADSADIPDIRRRETLTNNWLGLGRQLAERGVSIGLSLTQIYQANLTGGGGTRTHRRKGRFAGSYDLEVEFDLEKLMNIKGALVFLHGEGSWSSGLDDSSIGSLFGVNADAAGCRSIDLTELYYEQHLLGDRLRIRVGKLDLTGGFECRGCPVAFDGSAFANDESSQFLNGALVNNPTIPFPDKGLGLVVYVQPTEWWYIAAGLADAQGDAREMGFNTAFHDEDYFFSIFETGVAPRLPSANGPLQGTYRIGLWYDPQKKDRLDGNGTENDDVGFYLSLDQVVLKENQDRDDSQGLGLFARYGFAHDDVNEIKCFWSAGAQCQGLLPGRDDDVLGVGAAQGGLSKRAGHSAWNETVFETYYAIEIAPWIVLSPSLQYVFNPGGEKTAADALVLGFRLQISF